MVNFILLFFGYTTPMIGGVALILGGINLIKINKAPGDYPAGVVSVVLGGLTMISPFILRQY